LEHRIELDHKEKVNKVKIRNQDCNELLAAIDAADWMKNGWRGVAFLDPYAMELDWESLLHIANTKVVDIWYLFPLMAMNRVLTKSGQISDGFRRLVTRLLGTDEWENHLYTQSKQLSLFGDVELEKNNTDEIREYILGRFRSVFPTVSPNAIILRNEKRSPLFMLCFMGSNPSKPARDASLRVADHLLTHLEGV
jgi:three-Cys-motif partner protein